MNAQRINGLSEIADSYDAILCDVWGVLHNGVTPWASAIEALSTFRAKRGPVVMITNAPRPKPPVLEQLARIGVPDGTFDNVITSGDATRRLISELDGPVYHLGPERDYTLYDGLDVEFGDIETAAGVVCTGLVDDLRETPDDYVDMLAKFKDKGLPFICANPDIVVEHGNNMLWCAGALARDYKAIGGETRIVGKPHRPIYDMALADLASRVDKPLQKARVLAIGDGMPTDIAGALANGFDVLFISAGIHSAEYGPADTPDDALVQAFLQSHDATPVAYLPRLVW